LGEGMYFRHPSSDSSFYLS